MMMSCTQIMYRTSTDFPQFNVLVWTALGQMSNKVGVEHQPGLQKFSPQKKTKQRPSLGPYMDVLIEQVDVILAKKRRPRLAIWWLKSPRLQCGFPVPTSDHMPIPPAKRLKTDQKSVPLARLLSIGAGFRSTPLKINMEHVLMEVWKILFLSKWMICRFHVNLPGCKWKVTIGKVFSYQKQISRTGEVFRI